MKIGFVKEPVSFHRKMVAASLEASRKKHVIHSIIEADITNIRTAMESFEKRMGEKLSLTADIHEALSRAKRTDARALGDFTGISWINLIPGFLLTSVIRLFAGSIRMAEKYGVCAVSAVGMFSRSASWFIPITNATVTMTIGGIRNNRAVPDGLSVNEKLCITLSFDHDIIDGAPAARFIRRLTEQLENHPELPI